ncbi:hypothetical protein NQD34_015754 [Periophthalmus magnuspinnatus]|nr:hypothetical protein NQD34_015754 [Periophthalmus magnuspinnatus]
MSFFHQLRLLLWKNGLGIVRRPVWSVTLILWPIIIFIIIAVTRYQFPPVLRKTCYVAPRNLPSTGFFPFLETLMCNSDSSCHNTSQLAYLKQPQRNKRSTQSEDTPLTKLLKGQRLMQFANLKNTTQDPTLLLNSLYNIFGSSSQRPLDHVSETITKDQPMVNLTESAAKLKSVICTIALPLVNTTSPDHTAKALIAFCSSNNTVFEVAINTLNKVLVELMTSQPKELAKFVEKAVMFFDQLQKEHLLWESLLSLPQIFNPESPDQLLSNLEKLFKSLQLVLNITEHNFPEVEANLSSVHPFLVAGISMTRYMQNWPGKTVYIRFGDVVVNNETLWQMLANVELSLDLAIGLAFHREVVSDLVCKNTSNPMLIAACATGTLDKFLDWVDPKKLDQQILLTWSKDVFPHDFAYVKGLLHSLGVDFGHSEIPRATRSIEEQPQNIEEELFLAVGKVVMEILQLSPEANTILQHILRAGYQSMRAGTQAIETVEEMMEKLVKDVTTFKMIIQTLSTNQSQTTLWTDQAFSSVFEIIVKIFAGEPLTCESILEEFEWVFSIKTVKPEVWQSLFCGNASTIEQTLLSDWMALKENALALYNVFLCDTSYNVTLSMILSEWHKLYNESLKFGTFLEQLSEEWGGAYWKDWVPTNSSANHLTTSLQQSVSFFIVNLGWKFEQSDLWPQAKSYFFIANWILNYKAGVTTLPNCSMNMETFSIECEGNFSWQQFVNALSQALMSPTEELIISYLKGSVQLLQHVYSGFYEYQAASYLHKAIKGGDMLSAFLSNMLKELNNFVFTLTKLPDKSFTNAQVMVPLYQKLLESTGLKPLLPLILSNGPVNTSQVLGVVSQLGRSNQGIFKFNESDPTIAELEKYIMQFLSLEGNLSMSVYLDMSHTLLTYFNHFSPDYVAKVKEALKPFTNKTSSGIVEAILSAVELLQTIMDSPSGDPSHVVLGYVRQLQQFLVFLFRMEMIEQIKLPNGQVSAIQVTQLHLLSDIFNLLTPEGIMSLTHVGPVAAQHIIIQKYIQSLPVKIRSQAAEFLNEFVSLQSQLSQCESDEDCLDGISEMLDFLDQILDMTLNANGNASINIAETKMHMGSKEHMSVASAFFSLLLKPNEVAYLRTAQETLKFISILLNHQNITVRDVQEALKQTNLTIEELNKFAMLLGTKNVNDLIQKLNKLLNVQKCFEQETSPELIAHCAVEMVKSISGFLMHLPALKNETSILSMIPVIVNKTVTEIINTNFTSNPQKAVTGALNTILANVKMTLQQNNLSSPEILNELKVLESLVKLAANPEPLKYLNIPMNEFNAGSAELKIILWYLKRLENVTSSSSVSHLFYPVFRVTQMQVALALAQMDLNQFIGQQISNLTKSLQYPVDADGASKIGNTTIEILEHVIKFVVANLEAQNIPASIFGYAPPVNMTCVNITVLQINSYVKLLKQWMAQANFGAWGDLNNTSIIVNDIHHLLQSTLHFFNVDQQNYMNLISNITQTLNKVIMLAEQPNGLQSDQFLAAILKVVKSVMQLIQQTGSVPVSVQQNVLEVVKNTVWLAVHPNASYALALNKTLDTIQKLEIIFKQVMPPEVAQYLLGALKIIGTYFQSVGTVYGPDGWNQLILNEMETLKSLLPPNSTAEFYVSTIISVTKSILHSALGNTTQSLMPKGSSEERIPYIFAELVKVLNAFCPLIMGDSCVPLNTSSVQSFADLPKVLEELMTNRANDETWMKLQKLVEVLMTFFTEPEMLNNLTCLVEMAEKLSQEDVKNMKAETELILSLQKPLMTLVTEITRSLNGSRFNMSEMIERLEQAIEQTIIATEKTNGTLNCQEALKLWEPVREAAGLSPSSMGMWCNVSLQPVIDGYVNEIAQAQQNWTCTEMGPMSIDAAAARIVKSVRAIYETDVTQSHVTEQFIEAFYSQLSTLVSRPLSDQAKLNLHKQLQALQTQSSLQSIKLISEELQDKFPFLKPYMGALEKMLIHILTKYPEMEESPEDCFREASVILLRALNVSSTDIHQMMMGNFSDKAWVDLVLKSIQIVIDMNVFGDNPMLYHTLGQLLTSSNTRMIMDKVAEMVSWFASTEAKGLDLLVQALTKIQELLSPLLSFLKDMDVDLPPNLQVLDDLTGNAISFIRQLLTGRGISMADHYMLTDYSMSNHNATRARHRREATFMPVRGQMDDFIDLFSINYHSMWQGLMVPPTTSEIVETVHVLFANPDLGIILKGATEDLVWSLESSKEETIDAVVGVASLFSVPGIDFSSLDLWVHAVKLLPDGFPYVSLLKKVTRAIATESPENLRLMQETLQTMTRLLQTDPTDPQLLQQLKHLQQQVCDLEKTNPLQILERGLSLEPGEFCNGIVPGLQILAEGLLFNTSTLVDNIFEVFVGDPRLYNLHTNWTSLITEGLGLNISSLSGLNMTSPAPVVTIGEMVRNKAAFMLDLQKLGFASEVVNLLTETTLPDNNVQILSWLISLHRCNSTNPYNMTESKKALFESFCSLTADQWYSFTLLMAQHLNTEKFLYRMVLPEEIQSLVQTMLQMATTVINMMKGMLPAVRQLEEYLISIESLSLAANNEFRQLSRAQRTTLSSKATFVTISRALCSKGILALFGVANNPQFSMSPPTFDNSGLKQEMIERFKIPQDATPFCTGMYLDMVNTTGGAIAWAFLKPMLMGKILYTPDTPQTRAIMTKANSTLQQLADLRHYSQDWIKSSNYIVKSSEMLTQTLPLLQNSLGNSFVKNFIEMQTGINVDSMQETLNNFSNMTVMLEKNTDLLRQITTLSTLMVDLSSCITFDRYQGYDTEEELNTEAQDLAKDRNLYASVIFKLPKDSRKRRSASNMTTLPPKVRYTIRMHMDNVMRTDRVREPFFTKDTHISAGQTLRYNRGFIYLQESIDRAIIEIQANKTVTDTAVQIQPFPYPCHHRDEYLEAISFVFPLLLMIAWVLFVADFVKKLVHEREMKLHEYMKMMGVNPLSHFFAWFLESAFYLVITIFFLTLVLKYGNILPHSNGFLLFLYLCDYGLSILAFSFLISTLFDKTYIAALSGSLLYVLAFFPFIIVLAMEAHFNFSVKSLLGLFSPTAFSYASQYVSRYEAQGEGIQWSNSYTSPIAGDTASFGWLCWLMLIDTFLYLIIGAYIRCVFPGKSGMPSPWYFPFTASFWTDLCGCKKSKSKGRGLFITNIMQTQLPAFPDSDEKGNGKGDLSSKTGENFSDLPVGVALYGLTKMYGQQAAIKNLNVAFYEGHVTSLLGHNGAGKTTTMSILTGLFPPSSGTVEVYGRDMQTNLEDVRQELGVCMQYDVLFDHMTAKEHLLLYGQIKAPHWTKRELKEQIRTILEETGMYAHRHKRVGTLSGGMKRKLSISIAFIGGSRLVVLDEPTTGVDPCSRRSIWDIVIQHKKGRTIIMSTHHLDEAEVLSDRIAFLEGGGLKCCGSPFYLKDQLGQGYKLTLTKKTHNGETKQIDHAELKAFVQAHVPEARLKEAQGSDLVYLLPPFSSNNAASYRSLLSALDSNLDALQLGCYGISDTTLEEVFLHLTHDAAGDGDLPTISENVSDTDSINSYPDSEESNYGDTVCFTGTQTVTGVKLAWQQLTAILIKRFHHSRRDWKGLISQLLLPVLFVVFAMGMGTIKSDLKHYPELELSPALYNIGPSYSFFSSRNSSKLADTMLSFPGLDNACLENSNDQVCTRSTGSWIEANGTQKFSLCKCVHEKEVCGAGGYVPPHKKIPSSQIVYNLTGLRVENYLVATADDYIRNRYGGYDFGLPLPSNLQMDVKTVPKNRTLSKVWFNPEGHHTMPAYLSSMNNFILRANIPADKDSTQYAISVSSHPYFGRLDDEDSIVQGMLQIMVALCILAGYSITTASFAIYEVNEHHSGSKRLQHIAGVSEPFYWAVNFFYDMVIYLIPVALTVGVIAAFQVPAFYRTSEFGSSYYASGSFRVFYLSVDVSLVQRVQRCRDGLYHLCLHQSLPRRQHHHTDFHPLLHGADYTAKY